MTYGECQEKIGTLKHLIGKKGAQGHKITSIVAAPIGVSKEEFSRRVHYELGNLPSLPPSSELSTHDYQLLCVCQLSAGEPATLLDLFWLTDDFPSLSDKANQGE